MNTPPNLPPVIASLARDSRSSPNCTIGFFCNSDKKEDSNDIDYDLLDDISLLSFPLPSKDQDAQGISVI